MPAFSATSPQRFLPMLLLSAQWRPTTHPFSLRRRSSTSSAYSTAAARHIAGRRRWRPRPTATTSSNVMSARIRAATARPTTATSAPAAARCCQQPGACSVFRTNAYQITYIVNGSKNSPETVLLVNLHPRRHLRESYPSERECQRHRFKPHSHNYSPPLPHLSPSEEQAVLTDDEVVQSSKKKAAALALVHQTSSSYAAARRAGTAELKLHHHREQTACSAQEEATRRPSPQGSSDVRRCFFVLDDDFRRAPCRRSNRSCVERFSSG